MKLPSPRTLIAALSFAVVLSVAVVDFGRTAPGEIMAAHSRIEGLASPASCAQCHGGWTSTMTTSCLQCHETIRAHIDGEFGLHGILDDTLVQNCAGCHSEHHGFSFQSVNDLSFARAGVADPADFQHRLVGFDMDGAHLELECTSCHEHAEDTVVPEGEHRWIGLSQRCVACHEDAHSGTYQTTCIVCHVQSGFEDVLYVGHDSFLELVGGHAGLDCAACHAADSSHSLTALRGPAALRPTYRACADCHASPHRPAFVEGAAATAGIPNPAALTGHAASALCSTCHGPEHLAWSEHASTMTAEQHAASGFPLSLPHAEVDCGQCHDPAAVYAERYPGREAEACAACHADPHAGQFAGTVVRGAAVEERGCLACHAPTAFDPHTFDLTAHAGTSLPLEGRHAEAECSQCHGLVEGSADLRLFHGLDHRCEACHGDAHEGFFEARLQESPPVPEHGDCARCHDAAAFSPSTEQPFDHAFWTGYELTGSHAIAECTACHERSAEADSSGRTFGRIAGTFGTVTGCNTCHVDVHEGRFDGRRARAVVAGRADCARCHSTVSFREMPHGFDHGGWTGWRLDDAHGEADCTACHAPLRRPNEHGRTWAYAAGTSCGDCHESPHGTQFEAPNPRACTKCHKSAKAFSALSFDHDLESRFPLDEAHEAVACAGCHKPAEDAGPIVYRPLSRECVDCHGLHEKALRRRRRNR